MLISASAVGHRYRSDDKPVLRLIDLEIKSGTNLAIIGPSGSGKSTLLAVLGLLVVPTEGVVRVEGEPTGDGRVQRLGRTAFAWITQGGNLIGHRSARDNVALAALSRGASMSTGRHLADALLGDLGLAHRLRTPARRLSGGEAQRVGIARALATERPAVLADEPTAQLDRATAQSVVQRLVAAARERILVVVTHDLALTEHFDRVLHLDAGRLCDG